jgi:hypothetical protein
VSWILLFETCLLAGLCAGGIALVVVRNRRMRERPGNVPVRLWRQGDDRWLPAHGVWANDVFAVRAAPAAWGEALFWIVDAKRHRVTDEERKKLHRIGERPVAFEFALACGGSVRMAARREHEEALLGPFSPALANQAVDGAPRGSLVTQPL